MDAVVAVVDHNSFSRWVFYQGERIGIISTYDQERPTDYHVQFVAPTGETFTFPKRHNLTYSLGDLLRAAAEFEYTAHPVLFRPHRGAKDGWVTVHCPTCHHYGGLSGTNYPTVDKAMANLSRDHWKVVGHSARRVTEKIVLAPALRPVLAEEPRGVARAG